MYGEHYKHRGSITPNPGSSPHVRGALFWCSGVCPDSGIIPACAGSTGATTSVACLPRDHPRMCGEHMRNRRSTRRQKGSSPHVRGALKAMCCNSRIAGIIPACAGSTPPCPGRAAIHWDHPRMCGEHYGDSDFVDELEGSSPHVRGALHVITIGQNRRGIIPACAGSTRKQSIGGCCVRDHPRMCGEHRVLLAVFEQIAGSSPHVRGALRRHQRIATNRGIIPACAGSTARHHARSG